MGGLVPAGVQPGFRAVLRNPSFLPLYLAETQSILGDQLARVALAVLVYEQTKSVPATALTYAATFVPAVAGGLLLSRAGDRWSERGTMIGCDLVRALVFVAMAIPGAPLAVVMALLVAAVALGPVFAASEVSRLSTDLTSDEFRSATGLRLMTNQAAQVGGFALGGILVAWLHPSGALLINAATYVTSAALIASRLPRRPSDATAARAGGTSRPRRLIWRDRRLRTLVAICWLAGFFVVPEGLAVPVGDDVGATTLQTGLLFAAIPLGGALGALLLMRTVPVQHRENVATWMACAAGLPLLATFVEPSWGVIAGLWAVSGALGAYQIEITTLIVQRLPEEGRAGLVGTVGAGLIAVQGLGVVGFGLVAQWLGSPAAVACAGIAGALLGYMARRDLRRHSHGPTDMSLNRQAVA